MTEHSILPPSSAYIWAPNDGCAGWVVMAASFPEAEQSEDARNGDASHWVGMTIIKRRLQDPNSILPKVGETTPNGIIIDDEMMEAAILYSEDVLQVARSAGIFGGDNIGVEERLEMPNINPAVFGTADCWIFDRKNGVIYLWDFKYGHRYVEIFENWQFIIYLAGIINKYQINGLDDQNIRVNMRVVQPRWYGTEGPIREWSVIASDLRAYFNIARNGAARALKGGDLKSGPHCRDCAARHACPAALKTGLSLYETASTPLPQPLTADAVGPQLALIKRAKAALDLLETGYETQVESMIKNGEQVPGWMLEAAKGRKRWNRPVNEVIALGQMLGVSLAKDAAVTPNQAEKLGIDASIISAYSEIPVNGTKLVPADTTKAKRIFQQ